MTLHLRAALAVVALAAGVAAQSPEETPGRTLTFSRVLTRADYERIIEQPFDVPPGTRRIEVSFRSAGADARTLVDLGLRGPSGLRGWSGGSRPTVWVSALGATPGYLPGPIEPGPWAVLLGVPNIRAGRTDTVELTVSFFATDVPQGAAIGGRGPGWFVGDLHAHSGHSDGRARSRRGHSVGTPVHRVADAAVAAGLDFVALTDHNTTSHWVDVDRLQPYYDDLLLVRGRELTTYRGHANTIGERTFHEFRLAAPDASPETLLAPIAQSGAFVSINHPRLPDGESCMGCGWNVVTPAALRHVDGVQVVNGDTVSGPLSGWAFWARLLSAGHRLTAVGGSDEHTVDDDADRRLGRPATVVWAEALSVAGIVEGLKRGRVYVRVRGPQGPQVEFHAEHRGVRVEMGRDTPAGGTMTLVAGVTGTTGDGLTLQWIADGQVVGEVPVASTPVRLEQRAVAGRWFTIVVRDASGPVVYANAITVRR